MKKGIKKMTKTGPFGQVEIAIEDTPLSRALDDLIEADFNVKTSKRLYEEAKERAIEQFKSIGKNAISHAGKIVRFTPSRETKEKIQIKG